MGQFFKFLFASCLGTLLALGGMVLIGSAVVGSIVSNAESDTDVKANSVLQLDLSGVVPERANNMPVDPFSFDTEERPGLHQISKAIEYAATDDDIEGIVVNMDNAQLGQASASVIRRSLQRFKDSGKFIMGYAPFYSQSGYYVASLADTLILNPLGGVDLRGFGVEAPFVNDMLDKIGVEMQVFWVGEFKSATEIFRRNSMSDENREQTRAYLENAWEVYVNDVAAARDMSPAELDNIAENYLARTAEDALRLGLVDAIGYESDLLIGLRERIGLDEGEKINSIGIGSYAGDKIKQDVVVGKDRIAVVYAEGTIVDGEGGPGMIGGDEYAKLFRKLLHDDKTKAMVLRINSGGGSALASENMLHELIRFKEAGKPLIVSMGDVAASGGYYMACEGDVVLAEPNTITGSIGVFGVIPNARELLEDKMGIHMDTVKTGRFSTGLSAYYEIEGEQAEIVTTSVEQIYDLFLKRVADGRGMTKEQVNEVARGRVWTGKKAEEIGLVDQLGSLEDAIALAATRLDMDPDDDDFRVKEYPAIKTPLEELMQELTGQKDTEPVAQAALHAELARLYPDYAYYREMLEMKGVQARMPVRVKW